MPTKITWREEDKYAIQLLLKMQKSNGEFSIFPKFTVLDGRRFIDLNDMKEEGI
jgi:hypothetical protein